MKLFDVIRGIHKDHLYRNSIYLILHDVIAAVFGFVFWIICAKLFTTEQVGYATAIISAIGLVSSFSFLGLTKALIRYFPKAEDKKKLIGSCINLTGLVSIIIALIFLVLIPVLSPKLIFMLESKRLFILFIFYSLFWVLFMDVDAVFVALRKTEIILFKSLIFSVLKVVLPVILVLFGTSGILGAYYISALAGFAFTLFHFRYKFIIDFSLIKKMIRFSAGNYIAGISIMLPTLLLPIIITNIIGPEPTAYFYIAMMMAGLLFIIPGAVSRSLLAEGSYDSNNLDNKIKKAYLFNYSFLVLGTILLLLFGKFALSLFKPEYVMAYPLLIYFSISAYFLVINTIYETMWNIKKLVRFVIFQNLIKSGFIIITTLLVLKNSSIITVSQIWLGGEILAVVFSVIIGMKK